MEINRKILKKNAWESLRGIYWFVFLACIVASLIGGGGFSFSFSLPSAEGIVSEEVVPDYDDSYAYRANGDPSDYFGMDRIENIIERELQLISRDPGRMLLAVVAIALVILTMLGVMVFYVFISGPAQVSFARIKLSAVVDRRKESSEAFYAFKNNYKNMVKTTFLRSLYIFLWELLPMAAAVVLTILAFSSESILAASLIFVLAGVAVLALSIPAVVKTYQYMLVPYILAENPYIGSREALKLSSTMMNGFKWQTFVLRLSFLGWYLLGAMLCGVGILFVDPYYQATETLLYEELKAYHGVGSGDGEKIGVIS